MSQDTRNLDFDIKKDPYNHMMGLVFSRWKPFILRAIEFDLDTPSYFSRFFKQLPISQKVLSENLRDLENDGLILRKVTSETPPRVEYSLTDRGKALIPLLDEVYRWGWNDMQSKGLAIDSLGEMWHGYRERDAALMHQPYRRSQKKQ